MKKVLSRRASLLALGTLCGSPYVLTSRGQAQTQTGLPDQALRILVGFSAGGGAELMARIVAPRLELRTGHRVTVENKPNDKAEPAGEFLKKGLVQGSVVAFLPTTTIAMAPPGDIFPFDSKSDLVPLTMAGVFQVAIAAAPSTGFATFANYVAWLRAGPPERWRLGTTATDAYLKLYSKIIGREIGIGIEDIPHKGAASLVAALKAGSIPAGMGSVTTLLEHNHDGRLKIIMTSGAKRVSVLRDVPTAVDLGFPKLELEEWYGFFASSASPPAIASEWGRQLRSVLAEDEVVAQFVRLGLDVAPSTQEEAAARFKLHLQRWNEKTESFGMKLGE
jgi:tripartite-type tricarboxylate transporter receptor subunit TctC